MKSNNDIVTVKSPAEFFAQNKNIAGFDNPGKCLYTTLRELVENGLDAAEAQSVLPEINVTIDEISTSKFHSLIGLEDQTRTNKSLYADFESEKDKAKRRLKEAKAAARAEIKEAKKSSSSSSTTTTTTTTTASLSLSQQDAAEKLTQLTAKHLDLIIASEEEAKLGAGSSTTTTNTLEKQLKTVDISSTPLIDTEEPSSQPTPTKRGRKPKESSKGHFYTVTVKDNGIGMPHEAIPEMLGRVLAGTKYGVKQTRGKFGLGAKMALIWSKMSTGLPIEIWSATDGSEFISHYKLDIDIHANEPRILEVEKIANESNWRGSELSVIIEGSWTTYRSKILQYMRQIAIITPYARFSFRFGANTATKSFAIVYARRSDNLPKQAIETKHHPSSVDLLLVKQLLHRTKAKSLVSFFTKEFTSISRSLATKLINELGSGITKDMSPQDLTSNDVHAIVNLFKVAKFDAPDGSVLSPVGEYNLRLGIIKELHPDLVATYQGPAQVFEGHAFIVEAGISLGGDSVKTGFNVFRFANRIPLLFEAGGDVVTKTAQNRITWPSYKIRPGQDKIGIFVSIVSTKIPFKGTGKEYVGDDIKEIREAVKDALQHCCRQLKTKVSRAQANRAQTERKKMMSKYIPDVARALSIVFNSVEEGAEDQRKKRKLELEEGDQEEAEEGTSRKKTKLLTGRAGQTTFQGSETSLELLDSILGLGVSVNEKSLTQKLSAYIEAVDTEQVLEQVASSGREFGGETLDFSLATLRPPDVGLSPALRLGSSGGGLELRLNMGYFDQRA